MGVAYKGLYYSDCPSCRWTMIGSTCYSAHDGMEMKCPHCNEWCQFSCEQIRWIKCPWYAKAPDAGKVTENKKLWLSAVNEVASLYNSHRVF